MSGNSTVVVTGTVRGGLVVPDTDLGLPDGAQVGIGIAIKDPDPRLAAELAAWDLAGDEAWGLIDGWEEEPGK